MFFSNSAPNFLSMPATLRDTFQFYVTVADWGPLLMSGAILMSSLHLFESPNHLTDMNTKCVFQFYLFWYFLIWWTYFWLPDVLFGPISWQTWAQYFVSPRAYLRSLLLIYVDFFRRGVRAKKDGGIYRAWILFIPCHLLKPFAPSLFCAVGCTDVINWNAHSAKLFSQCEEKIYQCLSLLND